MIGGVIGGMGSVGFEPTRPDGLPEFESGAFNHSANSPWRCSGGAVSNGCSPAWVLAATSDAEAACGLIRRCNLQA